jgi:hypothetical protein
LERSNQVKGFIYKALQLLFNTFASIPVKKVHCPPWTCSSQKEHNKKVKPTARKREKRCLIFGSKNSFSNINWVVKVVRSSFEF